MEKVIKQKRGCTFCDDKFVCPDAFSEVSQYCGAYDHTDVYPDKSLLNKLENKKIKKEQL